MIFEKFLTLKFHKTLWSLSEIEGRFFLCQDGISIVNVLGSLPMVIQGIWIVSLIQNQWIKNSLYFSQDLFQIKGIFSFVMLVPAVSKNHVISRWVYKEKLQYCWYNTWWFFVKKWPLFFTRPLYEITVRFLPRFCKHWHFPEADTRNMYSIVYTILECFCKNFENIFHKTLWSLCEIQGKFSSIYMILALTK